MEVDIAVAAQKASASAHRWSCSGVLESDAALLKSF